MDMKLRAAASVAIATMEINLPAVEEQSPAPDVVAYRAALAELSIAMATPIPEPELRYDDLYAYANANKLDFNELCAVVRAAVVRA